jgi:hypothetical protein
MRLYNFKATVVISGLEFKLFFFFFSQKAIFLSFILCYFIKISSEFSLFLKNVPWFNNFSTR